MRTGSDRVIKGEHTRLEFSEAAAMLFAGIVLRKGQFLAIS
jgi:hypothetical protein